MGTYNSGCAKIIVPVLNQDPDGPMLMVSHANTNPGLTKTWDPGEPEKYYPTGKRNYARVVTTDDSRVPAAAQFVGQGAERQEVLRPQRQPDLRPGRGQGVRGRGREAGHRGPGQRGRGTPSSPTTPPCSSRSRPRTRTASTSAASTTTTVASWSRTRSRSSATTPPSSMMGPDGFTGYPDLQAQPEAEGMYLTFAGLSTRARCWPRAVPARSCVTPTRRSTARTRSAATRCTAWRRCRSSSTAIAKSDGTRKGVTRRGVLRRGHHDPRGQVRDRQGDQDRPGHRRQSATRTSASCR